MSEASDANEPGRDELCKHEGWNDIKDKKRGCTDFLLLLMLVACWVAMTGVGFVACGIIEDPNLPAGNPARLINSIDYDGRICGYDTAVKNLPYGYYMLDKSVVCVATCPGADDINAYICQDSIDVPNTSASDLYELTTKFKCMYEVKTSLMLNRCISDTDVAVVAAAAATAASDNSNKTPSYGSSSDDDWFTQVIADLYDNQGVVFGVGLGLSNVIAFLYIFILRIPGVLFMAIWGILMTIQFALLLGGLLLLMKADVYKTDGVHDDSDVLLMQICAYIVLTIAFLYMCLMCVMRSRVQLALNVVKEAARAMAAMPALIFMPVIQALGLILFMLPWLVYCIYLASSGDLKVENGTYTDISTGLDVNYQYKSFVYTDNTKYAFLYMLFSWFWTSQFIVAVGQITIALAVVAWYFTHNKEKIGNGTVWWSMKTIGRYHMGTAAFGSLIIAIIKTIRAVLLYIQKKARNTKNKALEVVVAAIGCCMWCVEKCMKFLNKNAYIQTAIYGTSFCSSCKKAFYLIVRNILRVAAVNMVADFILFLGRLFIPVVSTLVAYLGLAYQTGSTNGLVLPLVFVFIMSYFIGCMYSEIFGMSIETILCCFIADEEMFPPELRFAEQGLRSTMQITQQEHAKTNPQIGIAPAESEKQQQVEKVASSNEEEPML